MTKPELPTPTQTVAARIKQLRGEMSAQQLVDRIREWTGYEMTRETIANLEMGRRSRVSVDELFAIAYALGCSPLHLLVPRNPRALMQPFPYAFEIRPGEGRGIKAGDVRLWIRGDKPLPEGIPAHRERSADFYEADQVPEEWEAAAHPAVAALDRVRAAVLAAVMERDPFDPLHWDDIERQLQFAERHVQLLRDEQEQYLEALTEARDRPAADDGPGDVREPRTYRLRGR